MTRQPPRASGVSKTEAMFSVLRESADANVMRAIEGPVRDSQDQELCRINGLDLASKNGLDEERVIAARILHSRCRACSGKARWPILMIAFMFRPSSLHLPLAVWALHHLAVPQTR
jgi:Family of unknown function (DUF5939)